MWVWFYMPFLFICGIFGWENMVIVHICYMRMRIPCYENVFSGYEKLNRQHVQYILAPPRYSVQLSTWPSLCRVCSYLNTMAPLKSDKHAQSCDIKCCNFYFAVACFQFVKWILKALLAAPGAPYCYLHHMWPHCCDLTDSGILKVPYTH